MLIFVLFMVYLQPGGGGGGQKYLWREILNKRLNTFPIIFDDNV